MSQELCRFNKIWKSSQENFAFRSVIGIKCWVKSFFGIDFCYSRRFYTGFGNIYSDSRKSFFHPPPSPLPHLSPNENRLNKLGATGQKKNFFFLLMQIPEATKISQVRKKKSHFSINSWKSDFSNKLNKHVFKYEKVCFNKNKFNQIYSNWRI